MIMSLQKLVYISSVGILLVLNLILCCRLIQKPKDGETTAYEQELRNVQYLHAKITGSSIYREIRNLETSTDKYESGTLGCFIPPFPCDACVIRQLDYLVTYAGDNDDEDIVFYVSDEKMRNVVPLFIGFQNVHFISYNQEMLGLAEWKYVQGVVLFRINAGQCSDVFITNSLIPDVTPAFLSR